MREADQAYGTTYFWGAAMLPRPQRKHVYAVYALCRLADDIVDDPETGTTCGPGGGGRGGCTAFADQFRADLAAGGSEDPVLAAVVRTARAAGIDPECFDRFFGAMAMDLTETSVRNLGRPAGLHGGLGGGHRGDDAAGAATPRPGRRSPRPGRSAWRSS